MVEKIINNLLIIVIIKWSHVDVMETEFELSLGALMAWGKKLLLRTLSFCHQAAEALTGW